MEAVMTKAKKKVLIKNRHFTVEQIDGKEVWTFNWDKIEKDVKAALKNAAK